MDFSHFNFIIRAIENIFSKNKPLAIGTVIGISGCFIHILLNYLEPDRDESLVSSDRSLLHTKYSFEKHIKGNEGSFDYIVIGSGTGSLTAAAILARFGYKVLVLEKHPDVCGGGTHEFNIKGYRFDSGLHYTVPWSVPLLALTCLKLEREVVQFDLMGEQDGTIDKIYLINNSNSQSSNEQVHLNPFRMKYKEIHLSKLYELFPAEKNGLDLFIKLSNHSLNYVKVFIASRLFPKSWQTWYWKRLIPRIFGEYFDNSPGKFSSSGVSMTAKDMLSSIFHNKWLISLLSSMWIDTGCRPDQASFMLSAAVFRGVAMEGGCYPRGGSSMIARELVRLIESLRGKVLIRADVAEVIIEPQLQHQYQLQAKKYKAVGVRLKNGDVITARKGVISGIGYINTFQKLVPPAVSMACDIPTSLESKGVRSSPGFVMANIGIAASATAITATNTNTWHIPVTPEGDAFPPLTDYFRDLGSADIPAFITFPSIKDFSWAQRHPNKTTCQMLMMADYDWFRDFATAYSHTNHSHVHSTTQHTEEPIEIKENESELDMIGYENIKQKWAERSKDIFLRYFPLAKDAIEVLDISTPLSISKWISSHQGAAVGLDVVPERFCDPSIRLELDCETAIDGLWMTGQDTLICGVTLCQLSGLITAIRCAPYGYVLGIRIILQSLLKDFKDKLGRPFSRLLTC